MPSPNEKSPPPYEEQTTSSTYSLANWSAKSKRDLSNANGYLAVPDWFERTGNYPNGDKLSENCKQVIRYIVRMIGISQHNAYCDAYGIPYIDLSQKGYYAKDVAKHLNISENSMCNYLRDLEEHNIIYRRYIGSRGQHIYLLDYDWWLDQFKPKRTK